MVLSGARRAATARTAAPPAAGQWVRRTVIVSLKLFRNLNRRERLAIAATLIIALCLLAVPLRHLWRTTFASAPASGGLLREGLFQPVNTLNPFLVNNQSERALVVLLFDPLLADDGHGGFSYQLATRITELDRGLRYVVALREDRIWSNGERITADDVVYAFETLRRSGPEETRNLFADIEATKVDTYQIAFTLKVRDASFLFKLAQLRPVPRAVWERFPAEQWPTREMELLEVVSGPFRLASRDINAGHFVFSLNEHHRPRPYLLGISFTTYTDLEGAIEALRLREIDALGGIPANVLDSAMSKRLRLVRITLPRVVGLFLNSRELPGVDARTLASQIDRQTIRREVFSGEAEASAGLFSPTIRQLLKLPPFDPSLALRPGRSVSTMPIEVTVPEHYAFQRMAEVLKTVIPIKARVESAERINAELLRQKRYQAILFGINYNLPPNLTPFFFDRSPFNLIGESSPALTRTLQQLAVADLRGAEARDALLTLEREVLATGQVIFLVNPYYLYLVPRQLGGVDLAVLRQPEDRFATIASWYLNTRTRWR